MKRLKLEDIDKKQVPFQVPDGYFDGLEQRIQQRVRMPLPATRLRLEWAYVPAFVLILLASFFIVEQKSAPATAEDLLAGLTNDEILTYLEQSEVSAYDLAAIDPRLIMEETGYMDEIDLKEGDINELIRLYDLEDEVYEEI